MKIMLQVGIVFGICFIGELISNILPFAFPSSVISMIILLILLIVGVLKVSDIKQKTDFLLKNMAFFFIPSGVALIEHVSALEGYILQVLIVCFLSTVITFAATSFTIKFVLFLQKNTGEKRDD